MAAGKWRVNDSQNLQSLTLRFKARGLKRSFNKKIQVYLNALYQYVHLSSCLFNCCFQLTSLQMQLDETHRNVDSLHQEKNQLHPIIDELNAKVRTLQAQVC